MRKSEDGRGGGGKDSDVEVPPSRVKRQEDAGDRKRSNRGGKAVKGLSETACESGGHTCTVRAGSTSNALPISEGEDGN